MRSAATFVMTTLVAASAAQAAVVNVDINTPTGATYTGQGALADTGNDQWNGFAIPSAATGPVTSGNLLTSTGLETNVRLTLADNNGPFPEDNLSGPPASGSVGGGDAVSGAAGALLNDGAKADSFSGPLDGWFKIDGLNPSTSYTLYLYGTAGRGTVGDFQYGGTKFAYLPNGFSGGPNVPNEETAGLGASGTVFTENVDYALVTLTSDAAGEIWGRYESNRAGMALFNGLQISGDITLVPEPSSLAVIGGACMLMLRRARRTDIL